MEKPNEFVDKFLPASYWGKGHYMYINIIPLIVSVAIVWLVNTGLLSLIHLPGELVFLISLFVLGFSFFKLAGVQSVITEKVVNRYGIYERTRQSVRKIYLIGFYAVIILGVLYIITIPK